MPCDGRGSPAEPASQGVAIHGPCSSKGASAASGPRSGADAEEALSDVRKTGGAAGLPACSPEGPTDLELSPPVTRKVGGSLPAPAEPGWESEGAKSGGPACASGATAFGVDAGCGVAGVAGSGVAGRKNSFAAMPGGGPASEGTTPEPGPARPTVSGAVSGGKVVRPPPSASGASEDEAQPMETGSGETGGAGWATAWNSADLSCPGRALPARFPAGEPFGGGEGSATEPGDPGDFATGAGLNEAANH